MHEIKNTLYTLNVKNAVKSAREQVILCEHALKTAETFKERQNINRQINEWLEFIGENS